MANKQMEGSQQQREGVTIGTQGNEDQHTPDGVQGSHHGKDNPGEQHISNQERSSAANQRQANEGNRQRE